MGAEPRPLLICMPFNRCDAPPEPLVLLAFMAVCLALACLFCDILAPLPGFNLALQVLDWATILPARGPEVQRKPCRRPLPLTRLNIRSTPSIMAERLLDTTSCATTSCASVLLMALGVFGCRISDIFMTVFMEPYDRL